MPQAYAELLRVRDVLEKRLPRHAGPRVHDRGRATLYILQTRNGKRTGFAAVRIATDMVDEGLIAEEEALSRVEPEQLVQLLAPVFDVKEKEAAIKAGRLLGKGLPAGPGAASRPDRVHGEGTRSRWPREGQARRARARARPRPKTSPGCTRPPGS